MTETVPHLVSLVGGNPMSAFASIATHRPEEITLVHSAQTATSATRLADAIDDISRGDETSGIAFRPDIRLLEVEATNAMEVRGVLEDLPGPWSLDYTGGTKAMSSGARLAFEFQGPRRPANLAGGPDPRWAFYVDDAAGLLRSDDGSATALREDLYRLKTIARINGCELDFSKSQQKQSTSSEGGWSLENEVNRLAAQWLSRADNLTSAQPAPPRAVIQNLQLVSLAGPRGLRLSELDITVHRGRRVGIISCYRPKSRRRLTASARQRKSPVKTAKLKLFEVIERARQLGGDLTRAALATPLNRPQIELLRADLGPRWIPRNVAVFGRDELDAMASDDFSAWDDWWGPVG